MSYLSPIPTGVGDGAGVFKQKTNREHQFRTLEQQGAIVITTGVDTLQISGTMGADYDYAESNGTSTTTGTGWVAKVSLTTPVLNGRYIHFYSSDIGNTEAGKSARIRFRDETNGTNYQGPHYVTNPDVDNYYYSFAGVIEYEYSNESIDWEIQFRNHVGGDGTARTRDARIVMWRVD